MRRFFLSTVLLAACTEQPAPQRPATLSIRDSVRARRLLRMATRPDTFGIRVDSSRIVGAATAPVWIVFISDFHCQTCRDVAQNVMPVIRREFVETGLARLAFVNSPQDAHFNSRFAAHAALCAGASGRFWEMHDSLVTTLPTWDRMADPRPYMDSLAVRAGVPADAQQSCTARHRLLNLLSEDIERSRASGADSVPTILVGGRRLVGAGLTVAAVRGAVQAALGRR